MKSLGRRVFKNVAMGKRFPETNLPRRPSQICGVASEQIFSSVSN
jgi:hypothetical protein